MVLLEFTDGDPNISLEINDLAYYVTNVQNVWTNTDGVQIDSADNGSGVSTFVFIGTVSSILNDVPANGFTVVVEEPQGTIISPPVSQDYIFFAKNNIAELSSLKGYYGELTIENNSGAKAELFSIAADVVESSK